MVSAAPEGGNRSRSPGSRAGRPPGQRVAITGRVPAPLAPPEGPPGGASGNYSPAEPTPAWVSVSQDICRSVYEPPARTRGSSAPVEGMERPFRFT